MIHYFNPGHETAVLNESKYYMPPANVVAMQRELSFLPVWYADGDDYVLVEDKSPAYCEYLKNKLNLSPTPVTIQDFSDNPHKFANQEVCLWGISPQAIHFFEKINEEYFLNLKLPVWKNIYKDLGNRMTSRDCLQYIVEKTEKFPADIVPVFFSDLNQIERHVEENSQTQFLAKAPFSSSGRGLLWLPKGKLTRTEQQLLHGHLKKQHAVSLEKALDKKLDFALEFYTEKDTIRFEGISLFQTNKKGAYMGNFLYPQNRIWEEIGQYIDLPLLDEVEHVLTDFLASNIAPHYNGYIGVDMLVYEDGLKYHLHPCLEINLRNNMGILSLNLQKKMLAGNSTGFFRIDFNAGDQAVYRQHKEMEKLNPAIFENGRILSGYLPLCPVGEGNKYNAYMLVEKMR